MPEIQTSMGNLNDETEKEEVKRKRGISAITLNRNWNWGVLDSIGVDFGKFKAIWQSVGLKMKS